MTAKVDEHPLLLGKVISDLQSLEFLLRGYLYEKQAHPHTPLPSGKNLYDYGLGEELPLNALTCYDTLGTLIDRYNRCVSKERQVDASLVELRDALAHGRISAPAPDSHCQLIKFTKPTNTGKVKVIFSAPLTPEWLKGKIRETYEALKKVASNPELNATISP